MADAQYFRIRSVQIAMGGVDRVGEGKGRGAVGSSDRQARGIVDQSPDPHKVKEHGRVDWLRSWGVVIAMRQRLENFRGQVEPRSMVG